MANDDETREEAKPAGGRAKPTPTPPPAPATAGSGQDTGEPHERFLDAHRDYLRALQETWEDAQSRSREAERTLHSELTQTQLDAQREWEEACRQYSRSLQEVAAKGGQDAQKSGQDAAREYLDRVRSAQENGRSRSEKAQNGWQESARQVQDDFRKRCESAWRDYLRAVQAAWAATDLNRLDPGSLAQIVNSQLAALQTATRTPVS